MYNFGYYGYQKRNRKALYLKKKKIGRKEKQKESIYIYINYYVALRKLRRKLHYCTSIINIMFKPGDFPPASPSAPLTAWGLYVL
jgi:hypothetical protein